MPLNQEDKEIMATSVGFIVTFTILYLLFTYLQGIPGCGRQ